MNLLICDDNQIITEMLVTIANEMEIFDIIDTAYNGEDVITMFSKRGYDVLLTDIDLPNMSGLDAVSELKRLKYTFQTILVSAYSDFAVDSFKIGPINYLLKPIVIEQVKSSLNRAIIEQYKAKFSAKLASSKTIILKSNSEIHFVNQSELLFIEKVGKKTYFHCKHKIVETYLGISEALDLLDNSFFRTHRSYIVNLDLIDSISKYTDSSWTINFKETNETALITKSNFYSIKDIFA